MGHWLTVNRLNNLQTCKHFNACHATIEIIRRVAVRHVRREIQSQSARDISQTGIEGNFCLRQATQDGNILFSFDSYVSHPDLG